MIRKLESRNSNRIHYIKEGFLNPLFFAVLFNFTVFSQNLDPKIDLLFNFKPLKEQPSNLFFDKNEQLFFENKEQFLLVLFNEIPVNNDLIDKFENDIETFKTAYYFNKHLKEFYIGETQLILSLLHMKKGNQFQSAKSFMKAHQSFSNNIKKYPNFKDPEIPLKFMEISASVLPKSLKWLTSWFGIKADKEKAIEELQKLYKSSSVSDIAKSQCYALNLYLKLQLNTSVLPVENKYPTQVTKILNAELLIKQRKIHEVIQILNSIENPLQIVNFLKGKSYFLTENHSAKYYLNEFVESAKTQTNTSAAYFHLYQIDILKGYNSDENKLNTLKENSQPNFRDKRVQREIQTTQTKEIVQARIYFDSGNYIKCINYINSKSNIHKKLVYYLANSYLQIGNLIKAEHYYNTLKTKCETDEYYLPKTAYNIAEKIAHNNKEKAIKYLNIIEDYDDYSAQKEIEAKSELLIKELNKTN